MRECLKVIAFFLMLLWCTNGYAHDAEMLYAFGMEALNADGDMGSWLQGLTSKKAGSCCNGHDGRPPQATVRTESEGYEVLLEGEWVKVPPDAVITEPNKYGVAVVWYSTSRSAAGHWEHGNWIGGDDIRTSFNIRCFLPGELY